MQDNPDQTKWTAEQSAAWAKLTTGEVRVKEAWKAFAGPSTQKKKKKENGVEKEPGPQTDDVFKFELKQNGGPDLYNFTGQMVFEMKGGQIVYSSGQKMSEEGHAAWQQEEDNLEFEREAQQGAQEQTAEPASLASPDTVAKQIDWTRYAEEDAAMDDAWERGGEATVGEQTTVDDLADSLSGVGL